MLQRIQKLEEGQVPGGKDRSNEGQNVRVTEEGILNTEERVLRQYLHGAKRNVAGTKNEGNHEG